MQPTFCVILLWTLCVQAQAKCTSPTCGRSEHDHPLWGQIEQYFNIRIEQAIERVADECNRKTEQNEQELAVANRRIDSLETSLKSQADLLRNIQTELNDIRSNQHQVWQSRCTVEASGVYTFSVTSKLFQAFCDQDTDDGGWMVFLRRQDGTVLFNRTWQEYQSGFGSPAGEYWLGLDLLHLITNSEPHELRVDMENFNADTAYASYSNFSVGPAVDQYRLTVHGASGTAFGQHGHGDSLRPSNGKQFSTIDQGSDAGCAGCPTRYGGAGWWYGSLLTALPTGIYYTGSNSHSDGVHWHYWDGGFSYKPLKSISMKIRPLPQT